MTSLLQDPKLEALLDRLHGQSDAQRNEVNAYYDKREHDGPVDWQSFDDDMHSFFADKMVALDRDKAEFCYQLCRALGARQIVEAGTSFGVSTLYLAAAVRDNNISDGKVIATEFEPRKADIAEANFAEAGLSDFIELRRKSVV